MVFDASAILDLILGAERSGEIAQLITASATDLHTPGVCDIEFVSAIRRLLLRDKLHELRARTALIDYVALPLLKHPHEPLLRRILELRQNFSAADAAYVALAEQLGASLVTTDAPLARAVRRHTGVPVLP